MQNSDPALFACYVLFVYFNGTNILRIEREMRSLGYRNFHRRNLYRRGDSPGWIAKYNWGKSVAPQAETRAEASVSLRGSGGRPPKAETRPVGSVPIPQAETRPVVSVPFSPQEPRHQEQIDLALETPQSTLRTPHFKDWLKTVSPNMTWTWRHQQVILEQLERVTRGECKRLMIFLPPRHGKSELVTVRYTAWRMQRDPAMNVVLGSYNQRLADRFSRKIRKVIADAEHRSADTPVRMSAVPTRKGAEESKASVGNQGLAEGTVDADKSVRTPSMFPFVSTKPANSVSEWETLAGGGFRSVGVGSGVTGFGASLIVIDDPIKSRAEAESETYRERVWDWFTDDLYTRLEPDGAIVLIQTRWHEDDLAGRLLRESADGGEQWDVVNLPAISERSADTPVRTDSSAEERHPESADIENAADKSVRPPIDWRTEPDIPLCPERYDKQALDRIRRRLGEYSFAALYQQRPTPAEGGLFKRAWFSKIIPFAPPGLKWKRAYDLAVSTKTSADYTASFRCAFDKEGNLYISGGMRARLEYPEQRRYIIDRIKNEPDTEHGIELALHGQALLQDLRREPGVRGFLLKGIRAENDKFTRALAWAPLAEEGKVILIRNSECRMMNPERAKGVPASSEIHHSSFRIPHSPNWIPDFLDEICSFPSAAHDDQVDAVSLAVQMLKRPRRGFYAF